MANKYLEKIAEAISHKDFGLNKSMRTRGAVIGTLLATPIGGVAGYYIGKNMDKSNQEAARAFLKEKGVVGTEGLTKEQLIAKINSLPA